MEMFSYCNGHPTTTFRWWRVVRPRFSASIKACTRNFRNSGNVALKIHNGEIIASEVFGRVLFAVFGSGKRQLAFSESTLESSWKVHLKVLFPKIFGQLKFQLRNLATGNITLNRLKVLKNAFLQLLVENYRMITLLIICFTTHQENEICPLPIY